MTQRKEREKLKTRNSCGYGDRWQGNFNDFISSLLEFGIGQWKQFFKLK